MKLIDKDALVAEIEKRQSIVLDPFNNNIHTKRLEETYKSILSFLDTLEVKEVDLTDKKPDWRPSKKQIESLGALVRYNIGVFDYQKLNEVAILYDDLTKI